MKPKNSVILKKLHKRRFTEQFLDLLSDPAGYMQAFVGHELKTFQLENLLDVSAALESVYVLGLQTIEEGNEIANPSVWMRKTIHRMFLMYHRQRLNTLFEANPILPRSPLLSEYEVLRLGIFVSPEQPCPEQP
jgi:hypothetical protein